MKISPANPGDTKDGASIPELGRSPRVGIHGESLIVLRGTTVHSHKYLDMTETGAHTSVNASLQILNPQLSIFFSILKLFSTKK